MDLVTNDHASRGHHRWGPSRMNYLDPHLGGCFGYQSTGGTSTAAEEGTQLHEILEAAIDAYQSTPKKLLFGEFLENRRNWEEEEHGWLMWVAHHIQDFLFNDKIETFCEQAVVIRKEDGEEWNWGTADLILVSGKAAMVIDFKFGWVPVPHADVNRQGQNYGYGVLQRFPEVDTVTVKFLQPKLNYAPEHDYTRADLEHRFAELTMLRGTAERIQQRLDAGDASEELVEALNPGKVCTYCSRIGSCPAYLNKVKQLAVSNGGLQLPEQFNVDAIDSPEKAAVAKAWVDFLAAGMNDLKKKLLEVAESNGGEIQYTDEASGVDYHYQLRQRKLPRKVGNAVEVAEVLKRWVEPSALLGACKIGLDKLFDVAVDSFVEIEQAETGEKITKKSAKEQLTSILETADLLSQPDGELPTLQAVRKPKKPEQKKVN